MSWSVCIFAHNEERLLPACIASLDAAGADKVNTQIHILENGSTDATLDVARSLRAVDPRISIHELPIADKTSAWNSYIHQHAPNVQSHIFIDGDVSPCKNAFIHLEQAFKNEPMAYAAAALPAAGRSQYDWAQRTLTERHINGNLYALSDKAIRHLRSADIRMPIGSVGEDGLLRYILATDLKGGDDDSYAHRIAVAPEAWFDFDSLMLNSDDINIYGKRLHRYSKRHFQNKILYPLLKRNGITAMPEFINKIYTKTTVNKLRPRLSPENFLIDTQTIKVLHEVAKKNK